MKRSRTGSALLFLLLALAVIVIGAGIYFYGSKEAAVLHKSGSNAVYPGGSQKAGLDGRYTVQIPLDYVYSRVPAAITKVPVYGFKPSTTNDGQFDISLNPYLVSDTHSGGDCVLSSDSASVFCEGITMTSTFMTSGGLRVYYGAIADDTSKDCTMNSRCPVSVPASQRYLIEYVFVVPDKAENTIVEFFAGAAAYKGSPQINGFEGTATLLHDMVIPSLSSVH